MEENKSIQATMSILVNDLKGIIENGLRKAYQNANTVTVLTYWQVGRHII